MSIAIKLANLLSSFCQYCPHHVSIMASLPAWFSLCKQSTYQDNPKPSSHGLSLQPMLFHIFPTGRLATLLIHWHCHTMHSLARVFAPVYAMLTDLNVLLLLPCFLPIVKCSSFSSSTPSRNHSSFVPHKSPVLCKVFIDCLQMYYGFWIWLCVLVYMCEYMCIYR